MQDGAERDHRARHDHEDVGIGKPFLRPGDHGLGEAFHGTGYGLPALCGGSGG
ncbi:Uncharacterised protein [Bordetella pertussis]|nr:Uncharacterised protein [Bordetella pertussis]CFW31926.1 Uncharacterised protein [Bordetella pertussis]